MSPEDLEEGAVDPSWSHAEVVCLYRAQHCLVGTPDFDGMLAIVAEQEGIEAACLFVLRGEKTELVHYAGPRVLMLDDLPRSLRPTLQGHYIRVPTFVLGDYYSGDSEEAVALPLMYRGFPLGTLVLFGPLDTVPDNSWTRALAAQLASALSGEAKRRRRTAEHPVVDAKSLRTMSHDINNAIGAILGYAEIVLEDLEEDHICHYDAKMIVEAGRKASEQTRKLLEVARSIDEDES